MFKNWYQSLENQQFEKPGSDSGGAPIRIKPESSDSDTAVLDNLLGSTTPTTKREKAKEEDDYVVPDEEPISEEDEEISKEEEPELVEDEPTEPEVASARQIDLKRVKEKYPEFAKTTEFRELRNAYYRESQYTEIFPTVEDAREAAENSATFEHFNNTLIGSGNPELLLKSIKDASPAAFRKVATAFLPTLDRLDTSTYYEVVKPLIKRMALGIQAEGNKLAKHDPESVASKALIATARNIMQFYFDNADEINRNDPPPDTRISEKEEELQRREAAIISERFAGAYRVADSSVERNLDKQILEGLDPDNRFNDFTRDTLLDKIKGEVKAQISNDKSHLKRMESLWKRAEQTGYNRESLSRIVSAYLERARPIIPIARNKYRSIAIKGRAAAATDQELEERVTSPRLVSRGRTGRAPSNVVVKSADPRKIDYSKTSDNDIFEGKLTLKGK